MYQLLLISHYLRRRMIPLFAAMAVTLCTAMVIIVMSVMGGFLGLMKNSAHKLTGDVVIGNVDDDQPSNGFSHYGELVELLEKDPAVARATPVIQCFAKLAMPGKTAFIQVVGVDGETVGQVLKFEPMWSSKDIAAVHPDEAMAWNAFDLKKSSQLLQLPDFAPDGGKTTQPAAVLGVEVNPRHQYGGRDEHGQYDPANAAVGRLIKLAFSDPAGHYEPKTCTLPVANELKTGFYDADKSRVYVPFAWLQEKLEMTARETRADFNPITGEGGDKSLKPARCTQVLIAGKPGIPLKELTAAAEAAAATLCDRHPECGLQTSRFFSRDVTPWDQIPRIWGLLQAVENEKNMMTFLFGVIGVVAVMMVAITFYMIVLEKTRDIGILRAIGASRHGVLSLFVRYGLVIGVLGSAMGLGLAVFVVTHLNNLQRALGYHLVSLIAGAVALLALVVVTTALAARAGRRTGAGFERGLAAFFLTLVGGGITLFYAFAPLCNLRPEWLADLEGKYFFKMWNPKYYYFDSIPDQINWHEALTVASCAIVASVVGALIPAFIAATLDPVESLRHE